MSDVMHLGMAGFGTVGSGTARILEENADLLQARLGKKLHLKTVAVRDLNKERGFTPSTTADFSTTFTTELSDIINDPEITVACELMGGLGVAKQFIIDALNAGKHVVTANKALLAEDGEELFALAQEKNLGLLYESSICGGIPIVQNLRESLAGNRIEELLGILNGTANYILSEMTVNGLDFATALKQAQELGYAETDPTLDIEGNDAAHKLALLIRLAYGRTYPYSKLPITGITRVDSLDIEFAREFGYRIKLIGEAREIDGKIEAGVFPALVTYTYLLARVGGNYNAVRVSGNAVGPVFLHGQGAGDMPTGSAVVADIMAVARDGYLPDNTGFKAAPLPEADILPPEEAVSKHYFRFTVKDQTGVMAAISRVMADREISIAQVVQKGEADDCTIPVVFLTHEAKAEDVDAALTEIAAMNFVTEKPVHYRIL